MASSPSIAPAKARKAQLARDLGVSRQAIGDLVKRGVLSEDKDGLIDIELARHALRDRVRPSAKTAQALANPPPTTTGAAGSEGVNDANAVTSYHVAKTLNEAAQARMNQLRLKEMQGELIRLDAVETVWSSCMASVREHLLQVRARLAPLLAAENDPYKIDQLLDVEHSQALQLLAGARVASVPQPAPAS